MRSAGSPQRAGGDWRTGLSAPRAIPVFPQVVGVLVESAARLRHLADKLPGPIFLLLSHLHISTQPCTMESEAFEDIEKGADSLRVVKDLVSGAAGGIAQVLLGKC